MRTPPLAPATPTRAIARKMALTAALALAVVVAPELAAQGPGRAAPASGPGEIRGTVVEAEGNAPIGSAAVAVWSRPDSALVAGAVASPNGSFRIEGLRPGRYVLRVTMMGYGPHVTEEIAIAEASPLENVGSIRLTRSAVTLAAVEVTAEAGAVSIAPDRNRYQARDIAPAATTATDVLEAVPSVQVDADGGVSLRGNQNVVVQINGRPSPMSGDQLAGYLRQLPANTIDRVEVIPNPSARYDPEGMAGILNIVLKQNVDLGMSGGLMLGASTADRYSGSGNLGYQSGPATWLLTYGYTTEERHSEGLNDRTRLGASRVPLSFLEQDLTATTDYAGHNLGANLDYRLSPRDVLSGALQLNRRRSIDASLSEYEALDGTRTLLERYDRVHGEDSDDRMLDGVVAFKRTLEPQRHEISAEVRYNWQDDGERTDLWRQPPGGGDPVEGEINEVDARTGQLTAQLDYTRTLAARTKLETGYRGNARWLDRDYRVRVDPTGSGTFVPSDLSNALELDEQVNAVYGVLSHGTGSWELQGGLRAERASRDFSLADSDESFPHTYTSLFPSGLVSYNLGERSQLKASYSRRIQRPGAQQLNPFPVFFDLQNVFLGNPRLNPEYTDALELGYQFSGRAVSLQVSPFYRRTTDVIRIILDTDAVVAGREVTSISFQNLDTGTSWGTDLNGSLRVGQRFNGLAGLNVFKMVTDGSGGEASLSSDAVTWAGRINGTYNVTPRTSVQAMFFYRAPMNIEGGRFSSMASANLVLRQKLHGERASVTLRLSDPFKTMRFRVEAADDNIVQLTQREFNSRALHLTFQYNFGRPPRLRQRPQEQEPQPASPFGG